MRKLALILLMITLLTITGCDDGERDLYLPEAKNDKIYTTIGNEDEVNLIVADGTTLESRISSPEGYSRTETEKGSFSEFVRQYKMKDDRSPVLLYDGREKSNLSDHAAVFAFPIENYDLQQCADSIMRMYAEYYWHTGQADKISFHFTNGFICDYPKWRDGYRVRVNGNNVNWSKDAEYDNSYEAFTKYLRMVFSYAGTLSMESYETEMISIDALDIGDIILKGSDPGHVVMIADVCENATGEKAFLLAQGYMPAQEFHVIKNPMHKSDPWYYENEMSFPLKTAEYTFADETMVRRLKY